MPRFEFLYMYSLPGINCGSSIKINVKHQFSQLNKRKKFWKMCFNVKVLKPVFKLLNKKILPTSFKNLCSFTNISLNRAEIIRYSHILSIAKKSFFFIRRCRLFITKTFKLIWDEQNYLTLSIFWRYVFDPFGLSICSVEN